MSLNLTSNFNLLSAEYAELNSLNQLTVHRFTRIANAIYGLASCGYSPVIV
jgi:hypothetical protein